MTKPTKKEIIESLNLQKEIFGDELFISKMKKATTVVKEPASVYEEPALFPEKKEDMSKYEVLNLYDFPTYMDKTGNKNVVSFDR